MDSGRIWLTRIVAPIVFLVAVVVLVVLVQRALDSGSASTTAAGTGGAVAVTTDLGETTTTPAKKKFYKVKTGDTLEAIAARFDTSVNALLDLNPDVDPLALEPGQRIRVS